MTWNYMKVNSVPKKTRERFHDTTQGVCETCTRPSWTLEELWKTEDKLLREEETRGKGRDGEKGEEGKGKERSGGQLEE